jgi:hypothetical protein
LRGRGGHGCLENRVLDFSFLASLSFACPSGSSSSCVFVMNHGFAVASGMSLC